MIAIIKNESTFAFSFNGIDKPRNYVAIVNGDNILIISSYDSREVLLKSTPYNSIEVNGLTYASAEETVNALTPILFTKSIVTPSGATKSTSNTLKFFNSIEGVVHGTWDNPITGNLTVDLTGAVEGGIVAVIWSGDSTPTINNAVLESVRGEITTQGVYTIYFHYLSSRFNVNIFNTGNSPSGDITSPVWTGASFEVGNISSNIIVLPLSEALDVSSVPVVGDFSVNDGANNPVTNVDLSNADQVRLTLTNVIVFGQTVTVSYTKGTNPIKDEADNESLNFSNVSVTNNVSQVVPQLLHTSDFSTSLGRTSTAASAARTQQLANNNSQFILLSDATTMLTYIDLTGLGLVNGDNVKVEIDWIDFDRTNQGNVSGYFPSNAIISGSPSLSSAGSFPLADQEYEFVYNDTGVFKVQSSSVSTITGDNWEMSEIRIWKMP